MIFFMSANRDIGIDQLFRKKVKYDEMIYGKLVISAAEKPIPAMVIMHGWHAR